LKLIGEKRANVNFVAQALIGKNAGTVEVQDTVTMIAGKIAVVVFIQKIMLNVIFVMEKAVGMSVLVNAKLRKR